VGSGESPSRPALIVEEGINLADNWQRDALPTQLDVKKVSHPTVLVVHHGHRWSLYWSLWLSSKWYLCVGMTP